MGDELSNLEVLSIFIIVILPMWIGAVIGIWVGFVLHINEATFKPFGVVLSIFATIFTLPFIYVAGDRLSKKRKRVGMSNCKFLRRRLQRELEPPEPPRPPMNRNSERLPIGYIMPMQDVNVVEKVFTPITPKEAFTELFNQSTPRIICKTCRNLTYHATGTSNWCREYRTFIKFYQYEKKGFPTCPYYKESNIPKTPLPIVQQEPLPTSRMDILFNKLKKEK